MFILVFYCHILIEIAHHLIIKKKLFLLSPNEILHVGKKKNLSGYLLYLKLSLKFLRGHMLSQRYVLSPYKKRESRIRFICYVTIYEFHGESQIRRFAEIFPGSRLYRMILI